MARIGAPFFFAQIPCGDARKSCYYRPSIHHPMARDKRSKPSNVVRSRSASLLGGMTPGRQREELPSNRFIELGDIALGNSRRREIAFPVGDVEEPIDHQPQIEILSEPLPRPKRSNYPKLQAPRTTRAGVAALLTRRDPPKPATALPPKAPKAPLPPKPLHPKPPNIRRPKPVTNMPAKTVHRRRPR